MYVMEKFKVNKFSIWAFLIKMFLFVLGTGLIRQIVILKDGIVFLLPKGR